MPLLDDKGRTVEDRWTLVDDEDEAPAGQPAILPLGRATASLTCHTENKAPLGVIVPGDTRPELLVPILDALALVVVQFPKFRDGRGFTLARTLRERHGFKGEIRATGDILPDQYVMLLECGFSTVQIRADQTPERWAAMLPGPASAPLKPRASQLFHRIGSFPTTH
ncbi:DUF934 domain-containing protein [Zavarzinia sp. CC-PAN008]|uniref:DUF934 domain-containing protein n=1 Tax=Zavarzinia sp. CC-PAN008 TaxID=3243332 RepID=UPI003F7475CB